MGNNGKDFTGSNNPNYKTGFAMKGEYSPLYYSWQNMKARCLRVNHPKYHRYGGRGITICTEWLGISGFSEWALNNGWEKGFTIDRINNDGNYTPENCQWVSKQANSRKKSTTKLTLASAEQIRDRILKGECEYSLAREFNVTHGTIWFIQNNFTHVPDGECTRKLKGRDKKK